MPEDKEMEREILGIFLIVLLIVCMVVGFLKRKASSTESKKGAKIVLDEVLVANQLPISIDLVGKKVVSENRVALITAVEIHTSRWSGFAEYYLRITTGSLVDAYPGSEKWTRPNIIEQKVDVETLKLVSPFGLTIQ